MRFSLIEAVCGAMLCGCCMAQNATLQPQHSTQQTPQDSRKPAEPREQPKRIAPGSVIPVQLSKTIDSKKAKVGDEIDAKVTQDMKTTSGEVLVAKDTKVVGHVTEAQPRTKDQKESEVGIIFDKAVMQGENVSLPMSIQAVIAPANPNHDNSSPSDPAAPSTGPTNNGPGRSGSMGGGASQPSSSQMPNSQPGASPRATNERPPITANTQGVVGLPNYELSTAGDESRGSVVRSEKGNVKLEGGTLLLLRVSQ